MRAKSTLLRGFALLGVLLILPRWWVAVAAADDVALLDALGRSVFRIEAQDGRGQIVRGSSVLVAPHTLVTNCHVVLHARDIVVTSLAARPIAHLVRAQGARDLCLLHAPGVDGMPVALGATADAALGDAVTAVGFARGGVLGVSHGRVEGLYRYDGAGRVIQGSAAFGAGKSGGALLDREGKLIGILTFKARAGGPFHFAVPVEWVVVLMQDTSATHGQATPFWQSPRERQPVFLRAAALAANGECAALIDLAAQWLAREPGNGEAQVVAGRARHCGDDENARRPPPQQRLAETGG